MSHRGLGIGLGRAGGRVREGFLEERPSEPAQMSRVEPGTPAGPCELSLRTSPGTLFRKRPLPNLCTSLHHLFARPPSQMPILFIVRVTSAFIICYHL